jgi:hypothetical protein
MLSQRIQKTVALSKGEVDHLPFFAGEETGPTPLIWLLLGFRQLAYPSPSPIPLATAAPIGQKVSMKINSSMKLPAGTYTIEYAVHVLANFFVSFPTQQRRTSQRNRFELCGVLLL